MAADGRRSHLCHRLARIRHRRKLRHDHGGHLRFRGGTSELPGAAAPLMDDAAARHHHAGGLRRASSFRSCSSPSSASFLALIGVAFAPLCGIQIIGLLPAAAAAARCARDVHARSGAALLVLGRIQSGGAGGVDGGMRDVRAAPRSAQLSIERLVPVSHGLPPRGRFGRSGIFPSGLAREARGPRRISQSSTGKT